LFEQQTEKQKNTAIFHMIKDLFLFDKNPAKVQLNQTNRMTLSKAAEKE